MNRPRTRRKKQVRSWDRLLWAVEMKSNKPELIGASWEKVVGPLYTGEPTRALLFNTRRLAQIWCKLAMEKCKKFGSDWKFKPVRVRELIKPL